MKSLMIAAAGFCLLAMNLPVVAAPAAQASRVDNSYVQLAQAQPAKKETVTHKVKRKVKHAWRNLTGYEFSVGCPVLIPLSRTTCTETGKDREDARSKCQARHALCSVSDAR